MNLRPDLSSPPLDPDQVPPAPGNPGMAPWRISNEGRYYSVTELGNIYDPVMWRPNFSPPPASGKLVTQNLLGKDFQTMEKYVLSIGSDATGATLEERKMGAQHFGGGNSLRIGRLEHPKFDQPGMRAAQLLDIFQTGSPGTNCMFLEKGDDELYSVDTSDSAYRAFHPGVNMAPSAAPDQAAAKTKPYREIYPEDLHASSRFRWVHGRLNVNSVPSQFEMEALLRGCFASANIKWDAASGVAMVVADWIH